MILCLEKMVAMMIHELESFSRLKIFPDTRPSIYQGIQGLHIKVTDREKKSHAFRKYFRIVQCTHEMSVLHDI